MSCDTAQIRIRMESIDRRPRCGKPNGARRFHIGNAKEILVVVAAATARTAIAQDTARIIAVEARYLQGILHVHIGRAVHDFHGHSRHCRIEANKATHGNDIGRRSIVDLSIEATIHQRIIASLWRTVFTVDEPCTKEATHRRATRNFRGNRLFGLDLRIDIQAGIRFTRRAEKPRNAA